MNSFSCIVFNFYPFITVTLTWILLALSVCLAFCAGCALFNNLTRPASKGVMVTDPRPDEKSNLSGEEQTNYKTQEPTESGNSGP